MEVVQVELGEDSTPPTVEILTEPDNGVAGDQLWGFLVKPLPIIIFFTSLESLKRRHPMYSLFVGLEKDMMKIRLQK